MDNVFVGYYNVLTNHQNFHLGISHSKGLEALWLDVYMTYVYNTSFKFKHVHTIVTKEYTYINRHY